MKTPKRPQQPNKQRRGFVSLEQFQLKNQGKIPSAFDKHSIVIGKQKNGPANGPKPEKRMISFNDLSPTTKITHPSLRQAMKFKSVYASRTAIIQDLLNRGIISDSSMPELIEASLAGNTAFKASVGRILSQHFDRAR